MEGYDETVGRLFANVRRRQNMFLKYTASINVFLKIFKGEF